MTTMTLGTEPSRAELELALRAALLHAPSEAGQERARRVTDRLTAVLAAAAGVVATYDLVLLLAS